MRATIAGVVTGRDALRAALGRVAAKECSIRQVGAWHWVALPVDVRGALLEELAAALGRELLVIQVEMLLGGRGEGLSAARYIVPTRGAHEDLTDEAREMLHEWLADTQGGGFDEDETIFELAWAFVDDDGGVAVPEVPDACFEDRWASALVARLVSSGVVELRGRLRPDGQLAHHLQDADEVNAALAEAVLELLIDSTAVAEVFLDEAELETALRETRPAP
jgi:hypothetical protein